MAQTTSPPNGIGHSSSKNSHHCLNENGMSVKCDKARIELRRFGAELLKDQHINKGTAFTIKERQALGLHGLLPPVVSTPEMQESRILQNFSRQATDLDRYIQLMDVQDRNEKLFYRVLCNNLDQMMPIVYTPTVGLACQKYGLIFRRPRGLFITIHDKGHIAEMLASWPEKDVKAIVVTDGERILGLGDLGSFGMGIPVGKLALYTAIAGVPPTQCLPVVLDVGTNNEELLNDEFYIGLKQKRDSSSAYDEFIDEFMQAVVKMYGQDCLIQFEDFGNKNAFRFLEKYRNKYCTFNDDIQGTASVAVAGILTSLKITNTTLKDNTFVFQGAGEASIGIAKLLVMAMVECGLSAEEARKKMWLVDSRGLICRNRPSGGINHEKAVFAHEHKYVDNLADVIKLIKPTAIIGASAVTGAFTEDIIRSMASFNDRPIIFALSNPNSKAECTAEQAYTFTKGKCVFASGSPFPSYTLGNGKVLHPGQGNNSYIFPGVALSVILFKIHHISDQLFLEAAKALVDLVTEEHLQEGRVYPPLNNVREVSVKIAVCVAEHAYANKIASLYPEPEDKDEFVRSNMYSYEYESFEPQFFTWPTN